MWKIKDSVSWHKFPMKKVIKKNDHTIFNMHFKKFEHFQEWHLNLKGAFGQILDKKKPFFQLTK